MFPIIDWSKFLKAQAELDAYVFGPRSLDYENTSEKRILALLVELHELANETKSFKFWSNKRTGDQKKVLEEYVDVMHFMLSLFLERGEDLEGVQIRVDCERRDPDFISHTFFNLILEFANIVNLALQKEKSRETGDQNKNKEINKLLKDWAQKFLDLSGYLGFEWKQVDEAYWKKWQVNIDRQNSGSY